MITVRAGNGAIGICLLMLMAGCSREQQDWRSAEAADTIQGYGHFIQRHPDSELVTQARTRVAQLGEDRDWQHAGSADTVDAYRDFLAQHPNGKWAPEARIRIENFSLGEQTGTDAASRAAAGSGAGAGVGGGGRGSAGGGTAAQVASAPSAVAERDRSVDGSGAAGAGGTRAAGGTAGAGSLGFGIQLGAFSSEPAANNEWGLLRARFAPELQGLQQHVVAADTASGRVYRLQAVVGDEARARAICDSLRKRSQGCVAVLPH